MSAAEQFADRSFRIDCGRMILHSRDGNPPVADGPGEIWQDDEGRLNYKIFIDNDAHLATTAFVLRPRPIGEIIPDEDFLTLEAQAHNLPVWESPRVLPSLSGGLVGGFARGTLNDLINTIDQPQASDTASIVLRLKGKVSFPCNRATETTVRIAGKQRASNQAINVAEFTVNDFAFQLRPESKHTVFSVSMPASEYAPHIHLRMIEALQFVLGRELSVMSIETLTASAYTTRLVSSRSGMGKLFPPLRTENLDDGNIWRMFAAYFLKIYRFEGHLWHPITRQLGSVLESSASSITAQTLSLSVALEGLVHECFPDLAPPSQQLLDDLAMVVKMIADLKTPSNDRMLGSLSNLKRSRNKDIIRTFIRQYGLDMALFKSWNSLRGSSAHGDSDAHEIARLLKLKNEVLFLLYSVTFAAIGYSGPRTDFSRIGWPETVWPPLDEA